jgi:hypothetical protein
VRQSLAVCFGFWTLPFFVSNFEFASLPSVSVAAVNSSAAGGILSLLPKSIQYFRFMADDVLMVDQGL